MQKLNESDRSLENQRNTLAPVSQEQVSTAMAADVSERQQQEQGLKENIYNSPKQQEDETQKQRLQTAPPPLLNRTNIPDALKKRLEQESGFSLDAVRVFYNSAKPEKYNAKAYTQGYGIYLAPGHADELEHELRHMLQKMRGEVSTTKTVAGQPISEVPQQETQAEAGNTEHATDQQELEEGKVNTQAIQRARKNKNDLLDLTVQQFDQHRKAEQMDWANDPAFTETERNVIWGVIDWGTGALGSLTLRTLVNKVTAKAENLTYIKDYCQAAQDGTLGGAPTVRVAVANNINTILTKGEWLAKLNAAIGGEMVRATMPDKVLDLLLSDLAVVQAFVDYYTIQKPILETSTGEEAKAFYTLVKTEGAKIADYTGSLTAIRNYHKFEKASLDKLKGDLGKKNKPLTLVLISLFDHNGAFIRDKDFNMAIQNPNTNAFAIEGTDVAAIRNLTATGLDQIAKDHGMGGKITQMMVAGHGNSKLMDMSGNETSTKKDADTGEYTTKEDGAAPISFHSPSFDTFWSNFFQAALKNMDTKGGLNPVILLNACLTSSNQIDYKKLKTELIKTGLDLDAVGVDPTTTVNQTAIRKAIVDQFKTEGSLVSILQNKAGAKANIVGAQASISSSTTDLVNQATGELEIIALTDPKVAGSKMEYLYEGIEPTGALKAVIESWAQDDTKCFAEMERRLKDRPANSADEIIIQLLYRTILAQHKNDILKANKFVNTAGTLHGIARGGAECRPKALTEDTIIQNNKEAFYTLLFPKLTKDTTQLVILQDWARSNPAKEKPLVDLLGDKFNRTSASKLLDFSVIKNKLDALLNGAGSLEGRVLLALIGHTVANNKKCTDFLKLQVDADKKLLLPVKNALVGYSEDKLRSSLGLPVEQALAAPVGAAKALPTKNVDIVSNDHYVAAMRTTVKKSNSGLLSSAHVYEKPDTGATKLQSAFFNKDFEIVGELKNIADDTSIGWYLVKSEKGQVGYMEITDF